MCKALHRECSGRFSFDRKALEWAEARITESLLPYWSNNLDSGMGDSLHLQIFNAHCHTMRQMDFNMVRPSSDQ
jgi:hypothetical protein